MSEKRRIPLAITAPEITGIRTPIFGVSWNAPRYEHNIVSQTLAGLLELYGSVHGEYADIACPQQRQARLAQHAIQPHGVLP